MHELRIPTRWTDFDALGHLTHAAYPVFLDEARDAFLTAAVGPFADWPNVIAHLSLDYRREIRHPAADVTVRTRVAEVGRTSVTFEQEVLAPDGAVPHRHGRWSSPGTRRRAGAREISATDRAALEA